MPDIIKKMNIFKYLKEICILVLFAWISFFPEPIQEKYWLYAQIFFGVFLLYFISNKKYLKYVFNLQDWGLWLFLICLSGGIIFATDKNIALKTYIHLTVTFIFLFYIGKSLSLFDEYRDKIILAICICGSLVALIGILELYFGKNILYENFIFNPFYKRHLEIGYHRRILSTQFNSAVLGTYLLCCLPFTFYFFTNKSLCLRLLSFFSLLICIVVLVLAFARGAFVGAIVMLLFYLGRKIKIKFVITLAFCLIIVLLINSYPKNIYLNRFSLKRMAIDIFSPGYRLSRFNMGIKILRDHPFFGIGLNHFRIRFEEYYAGEDGSVEYTFRVPDNMYLTFLTETGIIGLLSFLIFIFSLFKRGLKQFSVLDDEGRKQVLLITMSALTGLLVNMWAYDLFYWNGPYMFFSVFCGFVGASGKPVSA